MSLSASIGRGIGRWLSKFLPKRRTEAEKIARAKARADELDAKALQKVQRMEAQFYARMIPDALARQKIASITTRDKRMVVNKVKIRTPILIHEDYYMIQIDATRLPYGVNIDQLEDPATIKTLSAACHVPVEVRFSPNEGFWYVIPRRGGLGIIPRMVGYADILAMMPKSGNRWTFPIGLGENRKIISADLRKTPHMLMAGSTGMGKSVFLKGLLITLCQQVPPHELRFIVADFKQGADFVPLMALPHVGTPDGRFTGMVTEPGDLVPVLQWARAEIDRRNRIFAEHSAAGIANIDQYNAKYRAHPLPHIILMLDEIPVAMLEIRKKSEKEEVKILLSAITRLGRSPGVHAILGAQSAGADILDGATGQNVATRVVGYCTGPQSQVALGSWSASKIPPIPGRAMWRDGMEEYEIQLPYLPPAEVVERVEAIKGQWSDGKTLGDEWPVKVVKHVLANRNGLCNLNEVYQDLRADISKLDLSMLLRDMTLHTNEAGQDEPVISVDDVEYVLLPEIPTKSPRRVVTLVEWQAMKSEKLRPKPVEETAPVSFEELARWCIDCKDGYFPQREIYKQFRPRGLTQKQIETYGKEAENKEFLVFGKPYRLEPAKVPKARRFIALQIVTTVPISQNSDDVAQGINKAIEIEPILTPNEEVLNDVWSIDRLEGEPESGTENEQNIFPEFEIVATKEEIVTAQEITEKGGEERG